MNLERELSSMRKREQELYKFILEKFIEFQTKCDNANDVKDKVAENTQQIQEFLNRIFVIEQDYLKHSDLTTVFDKLKELEQSSTEQQPTDFSDRILKIEEDYLKNADLTTVLEKLKELQQIASEQAPTEQSSTEQAPTEQSSTEQAPIISSSKCFVATDDYTLKDETVIFTKTTKNIVLTIPSPTEDMIGREIKIINTENCNTKVTTSTGIKIGGNYEKNLKGRGQTLKIITDGLSYFVI